MNESNTNNSSALKVYKQLTYIQTFDGEIYTTEVTPDALAENMNKNKFLKLWNELLNISNIKSVFTKQTDEIDNALLQISDKNLRARIQAEVDERRKTWSRLNMEIYKNILDRLSK